MKGDFAGRLKAAFSQPLTEKYRPRRLEDIVGQEGPRRVLTALVASPYPSSWVLVGPSGLGKTTAALAVANTMPAELHHIAAGECRLEIVQETCRRCHYAPCRLQDWKPVQFHVVLADEADQMSIAAQHAFLSQLEEPVGPPKTIFIFTCNTTNAIENRFLSRCRVLTFSSENLGDELERFLRRIWSLENRNGRAAPDFAGIVRGSGCNVRSAANLLEMALMLNDCQPLGAEIAGRKPRLLSERSHKYVVTYIDAASAEIHPLALLVPDAPEEDFPALMKDIELRGVRTPAVRYQAKIIDGKRRLRACRQVGVAFPVIEYEGSDPVAEIISLNVRRRQLNTSQLAMFGGRLANYRHGGDRRSNQDASLQLDLVSVKQAAGLLQVSVRSIETARKILSQGDSDLIAAVDAGKISVSGAAKMLRAAEPAAEAALDSAARNWYVLRKKYSKLLLREIKLIHGSGVLNRTPSELLATMSEEERSDLSRLLPEVCLWLQRFAMEWRP